MDDEKLQAVIEAAVRAAVEQLVASGVLIRAEPRQRLSALQLEQRRAAAAVSADHRRKLYAARDKRRTKKSGSVDGVRERKPDDETVASTEPVNGPDNPGQTPSSRAWLRYAVAYKVRYNAFPPRNAKANSLLAQLVLRIPAEEAPEVAEFYVRHEDPFYLKPAHPLTLLLRDAEKLRMQWATGRRGNGPVPGAAWWEVWSGIVEQGKALGLEFNPESDPTKFRHSVMLAAAAWGSLPPEVAAKLGLQGHEAQSE